MADLAEFLLAEKVLPDVGRFDEKSGRSGGRRFFWHGRWQVLEAAVADFGAIIVFGCGRVLVL